MKLDYDEDVHKDVNCKGECDRNYKDADYNQDRAASVVMVIGNRLSVWSWKMENK